MLRQDRQSAPLHSVCGELNEVQFLCLMIVFLQLLFCQALSPALLFCIPYQVLQR